jgi:hypothetical protein
VFWYSGDYLKIENFTSVFATQMVFNARFDWLAKVAIVDNCHFVTFYNNNLPVATEILTTFWPKNMTFQPNLGFSPKENIYHKGAHWEIFTSPYNQKEVHSILSQERTISHQFENNWTVVHWFMENNKIIFMSLHTDEKTGLNLWSRSEYLILNQEQKAVNENVNNNYNNF